MSRHGGAAAHLLQRERYRKRPFQRPNTLQTGKQMAIKGMRTHNSKNRKHLVETWF